MRLARSPLRRSCGSSSREILFSTINTWSCDYRHRCQKASQISLRICTIGTLAQSQRLCFASNADVGARRATLGWRWRRCIVFWLARSHGCVLMVLRSWRNAKCGAAAATSRISWATHFTQLVRRTEYYGALGNRRVSADL